MRILILTMFSVSLMACSHGNCRDRRNEEAAKETPTAAATTAPPAMKPGESLVKSGQADRVRVYKADGSLQCGQGKAIPVSEMQKQLNDIHVFNALNKQDGMMHIQSCGSPTGKANVYEINRKDLDAALKKGFKEWTFE